MPKIITVTGPISPDEMGLTLPHEHIMVDFAGAGNTGKHKYEKREVIETMLPYLLELKEYGARTFVDCTPMHLARDVEILQELSELSGIYILTNTGQYKEPHLPAETFALEPSDLALQWISEFEKGIEDTGIKPGFIKTAVNPGPLLPIQRNIITAAAIASLSTGLTIATHTGPAVAALEVLDILGQAGISPHKWIYVHAQAEANHDLLVEIARRGAWISLDNIGPGTEDTHLQPLMKLLDAGFGEQILLSHDAGWYNVGETSGGIKRPYTYLIKSFIHITEGAGIPKGIIGNIMIDNPAKAFTVDDPICH